MDEPNPLPEEPTTSPGLLPALFLLAVAFVGMLLVGAWTTQGRTPLPLWVAKVDIVLGAVLALVLLGAIFSGGKAPTEEAEPEAWLCQHCLKPYVPGAGFCPRCGAPLTWFSGTGKYERIHAEAWIVGKAVRYPSRALHLVGMCVIAGPGVLGSLACGVAMALPALLPAPALYEAVVLAALSSFFLVWVALLVLCIRNWSRRRRGLLPRIAETEYGCPPWFTYDVEWALPEFEVEPDADEEGATTAAG